MGQRLVIGSGDCRPAGLASLAIRIGDHVRRSPGVELLATKLTHHPSGCSRYLTVRDRQGRHWLIRVSNHFRPTRRNRNPVPHFDLVSRDGVSGHVEACAFVDRVAAGMAAWSETAPEPKARCRA